MIDRWKAFTERPWVAHILRAITRYNGRLGNQFAASLAYFSVLAMIPVLMMAFGTAGLVLERNPDLLQALKDQATEVIKSVGLGGGDGGENTLDKQIDNALSEWRTTLIFGLAAGLWAGSGWVGNLKSAIRAQWRPKFDLTEQKRNFFLERLINAGELIILLIMILLTFALASAGTALNDLLTDLLGLHGNLPAQILLQVTPAVLSMIAGWILFMFIYWAFPRYSVPLKSRIIGSLIAAFFLGILQYVVTAVVSLLGQNAAVATFGSVIILMLFFNFFGRLILLVAAWIATTEQPAFDVDDNDYEYDPRSPVQGPATPPPLDRLHALGSSGRNGAVAARGPVDVGRGPTDGWVTEKVAVRSIRAGLGAGWLTGIAAGTGIGAAAASVVVKFRRRRRG